MSVTGSPTNAALQSPVSAGSAALAMPVQAVAEKVPLFCDLAENTSSPIPSLAGC